MKPTTIAILFLVFASGTSAQKAASDFPLRVQMTDMQERTWAALSYSLVNRND